MKRYLPHALWFCIAVVAYWIGGESAHYLPKQDSENSAGTQSILPSHPTVRVGEAKSAVGLPSQPGQVDVSIRDLAECLRLNSYIDAVERTKNIATLLEKLTAENASQIFDEIQRADALATEGVHLLVQVWAEQDAEAAIVFLEENDEAFRSRSSNVYMGAILGSARSDLEAATTLALDCLQMEENEGKVIHRKTRNAMRNFALLADMQLKDQSREGFFHWAESLDHARLPESVLRSVKGDAIGRLVMQMVNEGEEAAATAGEYLASLPNYRGRDRLVESFVSELAKSDPESAMLWSMSIEDDQSRRSTLLRMGQTWWENDPDSTSHWLEQSNFDEELIRRIKGSTK